MSALITGASSDPRASRSSVSRDSRSASRDDTATRLGQIVESAGGAVLRYGLVGILLYLGTFKFTLTEAQRIQPLVEHSPLLSWLYLVLSVQGVSNLIGTTELVVAVLLTIRPVAPRATAIGSIGGVMTFLITLSFLLSTPGVFERVPDFPIPVPGAAGGFLLKDVFLLGASIWSAGEAIQASRSH